MKNTETKKSKKRSASYLSNKDKRSSVKSSSTDSNPISRRPPINFNVLAIILLMLTSTAYALPSITINSPTDYILPDTKLLLDIYATGADTIWYSLNNGANITLAHGKENISQNISLIANGGFETTLKENNSVPLHWQFYDSTTPIKWNTKSYFLTPIALFGSNALKFSYDGNDSNDYLLQSMFVKTGKKKFDVEIHFKPNMTFNSGNSRYGFCIEFIATEEYFRKVTNDMFLCFNNTDVWSLDDWATANITEYSKTDVGEGWIKIDFTTPAISENATYIDIALMPAYDDGTYTGSIIIDEITVFLDYGTHKLDVWANDTFSTSHLSRTFTISDNIPPKIVLTEPKNNSIIADVTTIKLNVTSDNPVESCLASVDGTPNETMNNTQIGVFELILDSDTGGSHVIDVSCNDTDGDSTSAAFVFTIDTTAPIIRITSPIQKNYATEYILLEYDVNDPVALCSYSLNNKNAIPISKNTTITAKAGTNTITISCTDKIENTAYANRTFTIEHPKNTYFQKSYNITTGDPFHLAYKPSLNNTETKNHAIALWGIYDTDNDNELTDEYTIQTTETIATTIDTSTYPAILTIDTQETENTTELEILIIWNTTIEPINFDLNRWIKPQYIQSGSWIFASEKEFHFILPTNFSINYTNVHAIWPYVSDGNITDVATDMPTFVITERGIETRFEKIIPTIGYFSGKGEHNKKTTFDDAYIQFSNTTTKAIANIPFTKHLPSNLKIEDEYTRVTSIIFEISTNRPYLYNFFSYGPLNGEASEWVTFDKTSKQYNIPIQIEGLHISTQDKSLNAANLPLYTAGIGFEKTGTTIDQNSFTHTGHIYIPNITSTLKRTITITTNHTLLTYSLTNNNTQQQSYEIWLADLVNILKNDNLNTQYTFYDNTNTTKELMHSEEKTRCIGIIEQQMHQNALYCPLEPYKYYIKNTDLYDNTFPLPPPIDNTVKLAYTPYTTLPSSSFMFSTNPVAPGKSATLSMYIYTSVSNEDESGEETFIDAITRMNNDRIENTYLQNTGSAKVMTTTDTLKELPIYVRSNTLSDNIRTIKIKNDGFWNYTIDETHITIDTHRIISSIKYNNQILTIKKYAYNNVTGLLELPNMKSSSGENTIEIIYIPVEPQWSDMTTSPESPTDWKIYTEYTFSIKWTDDIGIDTVRFIIDNTTHINTTNSSGTYTYKTIGLACGSHTYSWYAQDTDENQIETPENEYIITGGTCSQTDDTQNLKASTTTTSSSGTTPIDTLIETETTSEEQKEEPVQLTDTKKDTHEPPQNNTINTTSINITEISQETSNHPNPLGFTMTSFSTGISTILKIIAVLAFLILTIRNRDMLEKIGQYNPNHTRSQRARQSLSRMKIKQIRDITRSKR